MFEELNKNPKYVFRTMNHATASNVSAAHYVSRRMASDVNGYVGLNQNYAWGQDSWRDFDLAMKVLRRGEVEDAEAAVRSALQLSVGDDELEEIDLW